MRSKWQPISLRLLYVNSVLVERALLFVLVIFIVAIKWFSYILHDQLVVTVIFVSFSMGSNDAPQ